MATASIKLDCRYKMREHCGDSKTRSVYLVLAERERIARRFLSPQACASDRSYKLPTPLLSPEAGYTSQRPYRPQAQPTTYITNAEKQGRRPSMTADVGVRPPVIENQPRRASMVPAPSPPRRLSVTPPSPSRRQSISTASSVVDDADAKVDGRSETRKDEHKASAPAPKASALIPKVSAQPHSTADVTSTTDGNAPARSRRRHRTESESSKGKKASPWDNLVSRLRRLSSGPSDSLDLPKPIARLKQVWQKKRLGMSSGLSPSALAHAPDDDLFDFEEAARAESQRSLARTTVSGSSTSGSDADAQGIGYNSAFRRMSSPLPLKADFIPLNTGGNWFRITNDETRTEKLIVVDDQALEQLPLETSDDDNSFALFLRAHKCYHLIPDRTTVVVLDTQLTVKRAFLALVSNCVRAAPLWDSAKKQFVGMLTVTDFVNVLRKNFELLPVVQIEEQRIATWRAALADHLHPFISLDANASLLDAVRALATHHVHRLPVIDCETGSIVYIMTYRRVLRYLYCYISRLTEPSYFHRTIGELQLGVHDVATVHRDASMIEVLNVLATRNVSAVPVVDDEQRLVDIFSKFDVLNLAAEMTYGNLSVTVSEALRYRQGFFEGVHTCYADESLADVVTRLLEKHVRRLVIVRREDEVGHEHQKPRVQGIITIGDILRYIAADDK